MLSGKHGRLFNAVKSICNGNSSCMRVSEDMSEWFGINEGVCQSCDVIILN